MKTVEIQIDINNIIGQHVYRRQVRYTQEINFDSIVKEVKPHPYGIDKYELIGENGQNIVISKVEIQDLLSGMTMHPNYGFQGGDGIWSMIPGLLSTKYFKWDKINQWFAINHQEFYDRVHEVLPDKVTLISPKGVKVEFERLSKFFYIGKHPKTNKDLYIKLTY